MKVVIHAVAARRGKEGGATRVLTETIRGLAEVAPDHEYVFCLDPSVEFEMPPGVRRIDVRLRGAAARFKWDQIDFPSLLREESADLTLAALSMTTTRPPVPQVAMLTDATYFSSCASFDRGLAARASILARRELLRAVVRASVMVIVPTAAMGEGVNATFGSKVDVRVLRYGWQSEAKPPTPRDEKTPFKILYLSHLQRHKAHIHLVPLAQELLRLSADFKIIIGINRDDDPELYDRLVGMIERAGLTEKFEILQRIPPDEVGRLYDEADCFLYPSLCESFGLAMAEAIDAGLPVVAAGTAVNREVLGPGAIYFPPMNPELGAIEVHRLISGQVDGDELVATGQRHLREILPSWDGYARGLAALIEEAATGAAT